MSVRRRQNLRRERLKNLRHGSTIEELSLEVEDIDVQVQSYSFFLFFLKCFKDVKVLVYSQQVFSILFTEHLRVLFVKYISINTHVAFFFKQLFGTVQIIMTEQNNIIVLL